MLSPSWLPPQVLFWFGRVTWDGVDTGELTSSGNPPEVSVGVTAVSYSVAASVVAIAYAMLAVGMCFTRRKDKRPWNARAARSLSDQADVISVVVSVISVNSSVISVIVRVISAIVSHI